MARYYLTGCPRCGSLHHLMFDSETKQVSHPSCSWTGKFTEILSPMEQDKDEKDVRRCRGCGAEIFWGRLNDKPHPFDKDGRSHFATCPNSEEFRRRK